MFDMLLLLPIISRNALNSMFHGNCQCHGQNVEHYDSYKFLLNTLVYQSYFFKLTGNLCFMFLKGAWKLANIVAQKRTRESLKDFVRGLSVTWIRQAILTSNKVNLLLRQNITPIYPRKVRQLI